MKETISILLVVVLSFIILSVPDIGSDYTQLEKINGYIVTTKHDCAFMPNVIKVVSNFGPDAKTHYFFCDDIIFNKINLGDTINVKEDFKEFDPWPLLTKPPERGNK